MRQQGKAMEQWLKDAKDRAKTEPGCFIDDMRYIAETEDLDPIWFIDEVIKNIHELKRG